MKTQLDFTISAMQSWGYSEIETVNMLQNCKKIYSKKIPF